LSGSCAMFIRDVTIGVHRGQHICLPIDYSKAENIGDIRSNGERGDSFESSGGKGKCLKVHSNSGKLSQNGSEHSNAELRGWPFEIDVPVRIPQPRLIASFLMFVLYSPTTKA
jgi:hypothetical protein